MGPLEGARRAALKIPTTAWFRAIGPRTIPHMHRAMANLSGGRFHPGATIVLHTTGARSGQQRTTPLEAVAEADGSWLVVGSNFAQEAHPAWTHNLLANTRAVVARRGRETVVTARLLEGSERDAAFSRACAQMPVWRDYVDITDRRFRIFRLEPDVDAG